MTVPERKVLEAILLLADEPLPAGHIGEVLETPRVEVEASLRELARLYAEEDRGFVLREVAGGWRFYSHPDCAPWLERFVRERKSARLSGAALEVLSIVAYRAPISRAQIAEIRGIDSDGVVRTLLQRDLITESSRDSGPGAPLMLTVSRGFLERMGLRSTGDLPALATFIPDSEAVEEMESKLSPGA
ncbi:MAG: SMC-Scp complex subunit ScpB [Actinobacteria bacterium]|nr:SMC-Scp complex subunit ScpB [Actinomycetota bacterium]